MATKPEDKKTLAAELRAKGFNAPDNLVKNMKAEFEKIQQAVKAIDRMIGAANEQNASLKKGSKAAPAAPTKSSNKL